jgi:Asp/Glu/hydantoin racemase
VRGGRPFYGEAIGILLNKTKTPLLPGNVGNASTYDFPVRIENIDAFPCDWWCDEEGASKRRLDEFIQAAKELEHKGVRAITTGCGYFAVFQEEASQALNLPLFTSPLLLVPMVSRMIGQNRKVGILASGAEQLKGSFLKNVGIDESIPIAIEGMEQMKEFSAVYNYETKLVADIEILKVEILHAAKILVAKNPGIGAIVLECSDMPPFAADIQQAVNLPVFDYIAMINMVYQAVVKQRYVGFM